MRDSKYKMQTGPEYVKAGGKSLRHTATRSFHRVDCGHSVVERHCVDRRTAGFVSTVGKDCVAVAGEGHRFCRVVIELQRRDKRWRLQNRIDAVLEQLRTDVRELRQHVFDFCG